MVFRREFLGALAAAGAASAAVLPRLAPDITLTLPDNTGFKLSQVKGKVAAVSFISTG